MASRPKTRTPFARKPLHNPGESLQQERTRLMEDEFAPYVLMGLLVVVMAVGEWARW